MKTSTPKVRLESLTNIESISQEEYKANLAKFGLKSVFNGGNTKLQKSNTVGFPLPKYKSSTGLVTCPNAGECVNFCYAGRGNMNFTAVKANFEKRLQLTLSDDFLTTADYEIKMGKISTIRLHDSGDIYNIHYLVKLATLAKSNPSVVFYAYTKSHRLVDLVELPNNFVIIKSSGGKADVINFDEDRHTRIFDNIVDLIEAGYNFSFLEDHLAWSTPCKKIGLLYNFKGNMMKYATQFGEYANINPVLIFNAWVEMSGSKKSMKQI